MKALKVYERLDFERGIDPKYSMRIGQDYIKKILIDLFPKLNPGDKDYDIHQKLINNVILRPTFVVSIDKEDNNITVQNKDKEITTSAMETLFDLVIDHINLYSFPTKPKLSRIVDPMATAKGQIELHIF